MDNKKARERKFIEEVAQIYSSFPEEIIIDSESPDFIINQGTKIIGIEMVDYVRGQDEGESVDRRKEVLQKKN